MSLSPADARRGPANVAADAAGSPQQLSILRSACQTVAGSDSVQQPAGAAAMKRSAAVAADAAGRAEPVDADELDSGAATASVSGPADCGGGGGGGSGGGGGGGAGGGTDTGYALSSPVTGSRDRTPTPPADTACVDVFYLKSELGPAAAPATITAATTTTTVNTTTTTTTTIVTTADDSTLASVMPGEDAKPRLSTEAAAAADVTVVTSSVSPGSIAASAAVAANGHAAGAQRSAGAPVPVPGGARRSQCDVTQRPQQSPSEKVGAWLRNCLADAPTRNEDEEEEQVKQPHEQNVVPAAVVTVADDGSTGSSAVTEEMPEIAGVVAGIKAAQFSGDYAAGSGGRPDTGSSSVDEMLDALADAGMELTCVQELLPPGCLPEQSAGQQQPWATLASDLAATLSSGQRTDTSSDEEHRWQDSLLCSGGGSGCLGYAVPSSAGGATAGCAADDSGAAARPPPDGSNDPLELLDVEDVFGALPCRSVFQAPPQIVEPQLVNTTNNVFAEAATAASAGDGDGDVGDVVSDEDEDDGEDDQASVSVNSSDQLSPGNLPKRSTSLKSGKTPTRSRGQKKYVRFADAMGLDLHCVHMFRDEIPTVPAAAYRGLSGASCTPPSPPMVAPSVSSPGAFQMAFGAASAGLACGAPAAPSRHLVPMFLQPGGGLGFTDRLHRDRVSLESVLCRDDDASVQGVVRVLNLDYNKTVRVRYTTNNWCSWREVQADYVTGSCDGLSDRFAFTLYVSSLSAGEQMQFVISFTCRGETSWDNNGGRNYVVQLHNIDPSLAVGSPPGGWTGGWY